MPAEKVSLDLAVRYAASDTDLDDWRRSFVRASEILYYATDGQVQFGNLFVTVDAADDADADAFLCEHPGRSYSIYDHYMNLCRDEQVHPLVIVHEFGHFFFNLGDEYPTKVLPAASCIGNPDLHACIMEFDEEGDLLTETGIDEGKVREFCASVAPIQHQPGNAQHIRHYGKSCWEAIQIVRPGFVIPTPGRPYSTTTPAGHDPPDWFLEVAEFRYMLVLENSKFADKVPFADGQKTGAKFWVDMLAATKDWLGLVGGDGSVLFSLQILETPDDIRRALAAIDSVDFAAAPNTPAALRTSLEEITPDGVLAQIQSTVLVTASNPNAPPASPVDSQLLRSRDTNVFAVDVGPTAYRESLFKLAQSTKGDLTGIVGKLDTEKTGFALQAKLIDLACDLRSGNGAVSRREAQLRAELQTRSISQHSSDQTGAGKSAGGRSREASVERVVIEEGSRQATFVLSTDRAETLFLEIVAPQGDLVQPSDQVHVVKRDLYTLYLIDDPVPGIWTMRTQRLRGEQPVTFWTAAYSQNPRLFVKLKMRQVKPLEVQLSATAFFDGPLENIETPVVEIVPASLGDKKTGLSRASSNVLTRRQYYDQTAERWVTLDRTLYMGTVSVDEPGLYSVEVRFVNTGTATTSSEWCSDVADAPEAADDLVAPFVRVLSRQIKIWE